MQSALQWNSHITVLLYYTRTYVRVVLLSDFLFHITVGVLYSVVDVKNKLKYDFEQTCMGTSSTEP